MEWKVCSKCDEEWEWPASFTFYGNQGGRWRSDRGKRYIAKNTQKVCNACYVEIWGRTHRCSHEGCTRTYQARKERKTPWMCEEHLLEYYNTAKCPECNEALFSKIPNSTTAIFRKDRCLNCRRRRKYSTERRSQQYHEREKPKRIASSRTKSQQDWAYESVKRRY